jgi:fido (protein-threonine AMPylation protein)
LLHAENTVIPSQAIIYSLKGHNNTVKLLFATSLYDLRQQQLPSRNDLVIRNGLRIFSPAAALIRVAESFFIRNPIEAQGVLAGIRDASELLKHLLDGGHSAIAGRLAGALRRVGRAEQAGEILSTMKAAGYDVRETDPFEVAQRVFAIGGAAEAPIVGRLQAIWAASRDAVLESFPKPHGLPKNQTAYLNFVDGIYQSDAYHSLSIEGYRVSPELIERVRSGAWDPAHRGADRQSRDALAARGYWQAFQKVKTTVSKVLAGENPGAIARTDHREWYRELFEPCVVSGLIPASAFAGYRNDAVYLRKSRYVPPRWETVRDAMPTLFDLLEAEPEPSVRAVLGHWLFGYIHPYPDGNGRMARFLMNVLLASGGYPWTVVRVEDRAEYLKALDRANIDIDARPFSSFIAERVRWSLKKTKRSLRA